MKTKQEYIDALDRMKQVYYNFSGCMSAKSRFKEDMNILTGLVNEHFEEKQETNLEHYKDEIKYADYEFALVNGKPTTCKSTLCDQCYFNDKHFTCVRMSFEWMLKPYKKSVYKLTQVEYDLLQSYLKGHLRGNKFKSVLVLNRMKEKGYFKDVDEDATIEDILANCEVIKDGNC